MCTRMPKICFVSKFLKEYAQQNNTTHELSLIQFENQAWHFKTMLKHKVM